MLQQDHSHVNFREKEDAKSLKVKEHTGNGMDKFWEELVEQVFVDRQPETSHFNGDDSGEDEDMGDEEEEEEEEEEGDDDEEEQEEQEEQE